MTYNWSNGEVLIYSFHIDRTTSIVGTQPSVVSTETDHISGEFMLNCIRQDAERPLLVFQVSRIEIPETMTVVPYMLDELYRREFLICLGAYSGRVHACRVYSEARYGDPELISETDLIFRSTARIPEELFVTEPLESWVIRFLNDAMLSLDGAAHLNEQWLDAGPAPDAVGLSYGGRVFSRRFVRAVADDLGRPEIPITFHEEGEVTSLAIPIGTWGKDGIASFNLSEGRMTHIAEEINLQLHGIAVEITQTFEIHVDLERSQ